MHPILFVDLFKQSSYKTAILLSVLHKQLTYFSKKYSKSTRITLNETKSKTNTLSDICEKDNIKATKYIHKKTYLIKHDNFMFKCAKLGNIRIVRYYLNRGYDIDTILTILSRDYSLLSIGCKNGHLKLVKLLLDKNAKVDNPYTTPLYRSAENGHVKIVKLLLKNNADVNASNGGALLKSVENEHIKIVELLLDNGADIHIDRNYALEKSIRHGNVKMTELLIERGADINAEILVEPPRYYDYNMLWLCANEGLYKIAKLLLKKGATIDGYEIIPCAMRGYIKFVKLLLDYGASVHGANIHFYYNEPLKASTISGNVEMVKLLLENGANIHADNDYALRRSAINGHSKIVKLLLDKGANIHAIDINNVTPKIKKIVQEKLKLI